MLDELLGRASLKERIDDLEAETERLERQLEAESERRADAITAKQDAEEERNQLEDRIEELEDRIRRLQDDDAEHTFRARRSLRGERLRSVLSRLESFEAAEQGALSAAVTDSVPEEVRTAVGDRAALVQRAAPCLVYADDAELVSVALSPPVLPEPFATWDREFVLERDWFLPTGEFALAVVRSDLFAMGEYEGRERRSFDGFESDVKGAHSKGGFSQSRFERRREAQIDEHLARCREAIENRTADRLFVVGERTVLGEFEDDATATAGADATGDPESALADAFREFWTTTLYCL